MTRKSILIIILLIVIGITIYLFATTPLVDISWIGKVILILAICALGYGIFINKKV